MALPTSGEIFSGAGYETVWAGKWNLPESFPPEPDAIPWLPEPPSGRQKSYRDLGASMDADITDAAIRYLAGKRTRPFLLAVSLYNPHDICFWIMDRDHDLLPWVPEEGPLPELPELPENFDAVADEPEFVRWMRKQEAVIPNYGWTELRWTDSWDERHWQRYLSTYDRLVDLVDAQIGRVLGAISDAGMQNTTLVALTSDHGEACGRPSLGHQADALRGAGNGPPRAPVARCDPRGAVRPVTSRLRRRHRPDVV